MEVNTKKKHKSLSFFFFLLSYYRKTLNIFINIRIINFEPIKKSRGEVKKMLEIEKYIPQENWYVGLLFNEGYWFFKILRKQGLTVYMPYWFNDASAISESSIDSLWRTPTDALGRNYLEPPEEETVYQFFTGITPSQNKLYLQYTQREDRLNLIAPRVVPGNIGFWDGEMTSYTDPSPLTELWTVHDIYPYFKAENVGMTGNPKRVGASFYITPFTYQVIRDKEKIKTFLRGDKRCTVRTMGDGDRPIKAPAWLIEDYSNFMVQPEEV